MLFILKKSNRSHPTIIETDACKNVPELSFAIGLGNQEPVYIFQITPDGLYALCRVRNLSDKNSYIQKRSEKTDLFNKINCFFGI